MKISGFSYVRNGLELAYPFLESISSVLPICDEFIMVVGDSQDGSREAIQKLDPQKIRIVDTVWDMSLRKGGKVFAIQTNTGLDHITGDWALHIQADEVIHEKDLPKITAAIQQYDNDERVEGFVQPFLHFWGSFDYIRHSRRVHAHEVRIFRNHKNVRSYRDSQGFRKYSSVEAYQQGEKGKKLHVKALDVPVYHYNAVRPVSQMKEKVYSMDSFYSETVQKDQERYVHFDYQLIDRLKRFTGTHPKVMEQRIKQQNWDFNYDPSKAVWKLKDRIMQPIEDRLGFKIGEYKNYILLK
jgi:glycosyltransferase involved in cell wall biosynthesis